MRSLVIDMLPASKKMPSFIGWLRCSEMKSFRNFPHRFTKQNSSIKSGFYVCKILRVGSSLPNGLNFVIDLCNFYIFSSYALLYPIFGKNINLFYAKNRPLQTKPHSYLWKWFAACVHIFIVQSSFPIYSFVWLWIINLKFDTLK